MKARALFFIALVGAALGVPFLLDPGFGDDFTYWSFALDLHERGMDAWSDGSFHQLRWPVWLPIWIVQGLGGVGLPSYYLPPLLYLGLGAAISAGLARQFSAAAAFAWTAGIAFALNPLLDWVCYRPMPDLSEGVLGAATIAAWWLLMNAGSRRSRWGWAAATGALVFITESNRLTGIFIAGVLALNTLLFFRRQFVWLLLAGAFAALFYLGECCVYRWIFGDWLHSLHANLGGKGRRGTETVNLLAVPFRFLDSLWKGNVLAPVYCLLGIGGMLTAWRQHGKFGKVIVVWFWALYLAYACAPQQLWPWRPMLRDADRFLAGLAVPASLLAALGGAGLLRWLVARRPGLGTQLRRHPAPAGAILAALAVLITSRDRFNIGAIPEFRDYIASTPDGTHIFTDEKMRRYAILAYGRRAQHLVWHVHRDILHHDPEREADAAKCSEIWYMHKLMWLRTRKSMERGDAGKQPRLASYFDSIGSEWRLNHVVVKGDTPDLVFLKRRIPSDPKPVILTAASTELAGILPVPPIDWKPRDRRKITLEAAAIPEILRGKLAFLEITAASDEVEAFQLRLTFFTGSASRAEYLLKPYLYPAGGKEFFALRIPAGADKYSAEVIFSKRTESVRFTDHRLIVEPAQTQ